LAVQAEHVATVPAEDVPAAQLVHVVAAEVAGYVPAAQA